MAIDYSVAPTDKSLLLLPALKRTVHAETRRSLNRLVTGKRIIECALERTEILSNSAVTGASTGLERLGNGPQATPLADLLSPVSFYLDLRD